MKCARCGNEMSNDALFCGRCGAPVAQKSSEQPNASPTGGKEPDSPAVSENAGRLKFELHGLADDLAHFGLGPVLNDAISVLAAGPNLNGHLTVVMGEKFRGKTTVVNRLLRAPVLPTGRQGLASPVKIRAGQTWRALHSEKDPVEAASGFPFPSPHGDNPSGTKAFSLAEGPAEILKHTTLIDTPGLNDTDANFDEVVIRDCIRADLILICVSAIQLLSENERRTIRNRLLPVAGGEILLTVTFTDRVESVEDRAELQLRLSRFLERNASGRLKCIVLHGSADAQVPAVVLERAILDAAAAWAPRHEAAWAGKVGLLLKTLESAVTEFSETHAPPSEQESKEALQDLLNILTHETELALHETEAHLKSSLSTLRNALPERLKKLSPEAMQHEGLSQLIGEIQAAGKEAGEFFLQHLENALTTDVPAALQIGASGVSKTAAGHLSGKMNVAHPDVQLHASRPRDLKVLALTGVGAFMLLSAGSMAPFIGGALAIFGAHRMWKTNDQKFAEKLRKDAASTIRDWLSEVETELLAQLRSATGLVHTALCERLTLLAVPATPGSPGAAPVTSKKGLLTRIQSCREACQKIEGKKP